MEELQDSTEALLMEGMRQLDEFRVHSPASCRAADAPRLAVPRPLGARLRDLAPRGAGRVPGWRSVPTTVRSALRRVRPHRPDHRREAAHASSTSGYLIARADLDRLAAAARAPARLRSARVRPSAAPPTQLPPR